MSHMRKLGFLVLALALVATGAMTAQPLMAAGEGASGAEFTTGLFLPLVQAPDELSVEAAKWPEGFGETPPSDADKFIYLSKVHPANVCKDLKLETEDDYWYGLKVEGAAPEGLHEADGLELEVVITKNPELDPNKYFNWEAQVLPDGKTVGAVVVKGGPGANAYIYTSWQEEEEEVKDVGLHAPAFDHAKKGWIYRDISNVTFCLVETTPSTTPE